MIGVVVFKEGTPVERRLRPLLDLLEKEVIRGLGDAYVHFSSRITVYFVPLKRDFSLLGKDVERDVLSSVGKPSSIVYLRHGSGLSVYPTGNVTPSNPLLIESFTPRSVSPVDPDLLGTLWLALRKQGLLPSILGVHDPPSNLSVPTFTIELGESYVEPVFYAVLASFRKKKVFVPHVTVSRSFEASYFYPLIEKRRVPAYHLPYAWVHYLDESLFEQMRQKGKVRSILVEKGLVLPGELPHKEV